MAVENAVSRFCVFESLCAYPGNFGPGHQFMRVPAGKTHSRKKTHKE